MLDFSNIDETIREFRKGKYGIFISSKAKTDWFAFKYRSIEWKKGKLNFIIELFPDLDDKGNSVSWNFTSMVHFDENKKRYGQKFAFVKSEAFEVLKEIFINTLEEKYDYLNSLQENEIDFQISSIS